MTSTVTSAPELAEAIAGGASDISVEGTISGSPMITLPPGTTLRSGTLEFGARGVRLTRDNVLEDVTILAPEHEAAILNDTSVENFGTLRLHNVRTRGQVLLLAADAVRGGDIRIDGLHVQAADVRGRVMRPHGFGVDALQGGLTVWNRQADPAVVVTAEILRVSIGGSGAPIRGSGVFVGGHGDWNGKADGGALKVSQLTTGEVHTDGGIPAGTPDLISGGVFVISGAFVDQVLNEGPVTTYGQNDMVLDNWGAVTTWTAQAPVVSHGPSGIGFVNFGDIEMLDVRAPIQTHGKGARGFNLYNGSLASARFAEITTTGDGSVGIQVSKPMGRLEVRGDVTTSGGEGLRLVKGVQMVLKAIALSVKAGGRVEQIEIGGAVATTRDDVVSVEIEGDVAALAVAGGIRASGHHSDAIHAGAGAPDLSGIETTAENGTPLLRI